jgi:hypothetical protein
MNELFTVVISDAKPEANGMPQHNHLLSQQKHAKAPPKHP